jgi:uncharacterized protein YyaL (SSP411 family)
MQALQMMAGQGGWPLNIFLNPDDLVPFYGGTYFPLEPRFNRPGFLQVLQSVRRFYDTEKAKLNAFKQDILEGLQQSVILPASQVNSLDDTLLYRGIETSAGIITPSASDAGRPSFPMIPYASLTLQGSRFEFDSRYNSKIAAYQRGEDLALGGIYDHVGGGFHRYTVDSTWTVPHFEKMLYDNGQIVEYLANLWSAGNQEPAFKRAIADTVKWLEREMVAPAGYFYAAQDADNFSDATAREPEEGAFYVWNYGELARLLTAAELAELQANFTITERGNFEGSNVLQRTARGELSEVSEIILSKLFAVRYGREASEIETFPPAKNNQAAKSGPWPGRIPPVTDTKMIVAWNSLMISGLARAFAVFGQPSYWKLATEAAQFILQEQWVGGRFYRLNYEGQAAVLAQAEDYALFIKALLDLQTASPQETHWLEKAIKIQQEFDEYFWSIEMGGYYNNAADNSSDLLVRERSYMDNATPSANGVAVGNLVRLARLTENLDYLEQAEGALQAFTSVMQKSPQACPTLFIALDWLLHGNLVGAKADILPALLPQYFPTTTYQIASELPEGTVGMTCQGLSCLEPARTIEELILQIQ